MEHDAEQIQASQSVVFQQVTNTAPALSDIGLTPWKEQKLG
ncbi:MAG: hypothetical protein ACXV8Q_08930 [Methylobacter sp.]